MPPPAEPKIYHIVHVDRLASIVADGFLWCDAEAQQRALAGTTIGLESIKQHRLTNRLNSHNALRVGDCVPFYFCPRSIMLYVIHRANHEELVYRGGQTRIVHLEADLREAVDWADRHGHRWAFTLSNAGSRYFEDRCDLARLDDIDWEAVEARNWQGRREGKQAEFLLETSFPWPLIRNIGVQSLGVHEQVREAIRTAAHQPVVKVRPDWYYPDHS